MDKAEHRLFSHITMNWRGRRLSSHEVIVQTIAAATTRTGVRVRGDRLLDVLVVMGLRAGLAQSETAPPWFRAAADPRLSPALEAVHSSPGKPWTVDDLARLCAMSRATFARVFQQVLGQAPMQYLTDWRMTLARDLLLAKEATRRDRG